MAKIEPKPTWTALNNTLRDCSEKVATDLLGTAKRSKWPMNYLLRIQQRVNKLRRERELRELQSQFVA